MSHRTANDTERVRRAHADHLDPETADRVMNREYRSATPRDRAADGWDRHPTTDPAAVADLARDIRRTAIIPDALTFPCADHAAAPGVHCFRVARGVCASRLERAGHDV